MNLYVGGYTTWMNENVEGHAKGVEHYHFDESSLNFEHISSVAQRNPSYLTRHPQLPVIYVVDEYHQTDTSYVFAYRVAATGELTLMNKQAINGYYACHLAVYKDHLIISNYGSGNVNVLPINGDGKLSPVSSIVSHQGRGPNSSRQEAPHAHMVFPFNDDMLYIVDLGIDKCKAYKLTDGNLIPLTAYDLTLPAGSGPRHMVKHPRQDRVYVLGELDAKVYVYQIGYDKTKISLVQTCESLKAEFKGVPGASAIRISSDGKHLYISERTSSCIIHYTINGKGLLMKKNILALEDITPRDFIFSSDDKRMFVAGQDSHTLSVFEVGQQGELQFKKTLDQIKSPVSLLVD